MKEGSLEAPLRHPLDWTSPEFYDESKLDAEMRRVFDICHGCRRCFNLCETFPKLFDLIDESESMELDSVDSKDFKGPIDDCTLCDMCFMTKCPYVPPHEFDLDFPHLMLRARAVEFNKSQIPFTERQLTETDRNGMLAGPVAVIVNWSTKTTNRLTRPLMESVTGIDARAELPKFHGKTFVSRAKDTAVEVNKLAPAYGKKAVIYATCFVNYNDPDVGQLTRALLAKNGVETEVVYPKCCGMPQLEQGNIAQVAKNAKDVALEMKPWIERGYDVIALVPSCTLMLKHEWPLIVPDDGDVKTLSKATFDISDYIVTLAKDYGLQGDLKPLPGGVTVHIACHARAQNKGRKAEELLKLIPDTDVQVIERCSGHGGSWGVMKDHFETALKVGKPVARTAVQQKSAFVVSECPLAATHIAQGMEAIEPSSKPIRTYAPLELLALSCGIEIPG